MSATFKAMAPWTGASTCTGSVTPGARALMAYWLEQCEPIAKSMGIYNCRTVRGGGTTSLHGEGRACDCGIPVTAEGQRVMYEFLNRLGSHAKRLGIQCVIFDRTIWSAARSASGEYYGGTHPHNDHAHIELTWSSARNLNLATLRAVVGDFRGDGAVNERSGSDDRSPSTDVPRRLTQRGDKGISVAIDQGLLMAHGLGPRGLVTDSGIPDRDFGPGTEDLVQRFQQSHGLAVDGVVGEETRAMLLAPLPRTVQSGDEGAAVGRVQGLLMGHGYSAAGLVPRPGGSGRAGRPDRVFGPSTEATVRALQRDRGLAVDGIVGPNTYAALLYR